MGGVDLSIQLLQCYQVLCRTRKWWKTLFFILWCFCNKCIQCTQEKITEGVTHKDFRQSLAHELLQRTDLQLNPNPTCSPGYPPRSSVGAEHCQEPLSSDNLPNKFSKPTSGRKNCKLCRVHFKKEQKTPWRCRDCDIPSSLQHDLSCFEKWHTAECDKYQLVRQSQIVQSVTMYAGHSVRFESSAFCM